LTSIEAAEISSVQSSFAYDRTKQWLSVNAKDSKAEIFDVFLCHNSEDKPAIREIWQKLVKEGIKPWLDEMEIRPGTSWQTALEQQIENIKSAAVFVGERGVGIGSGLRFRLFSTNSSSGNVL
jgi:hypothetical protein